MLVPRMTDVETTIALVVEDRRPKIHPRRLLLLRRRRRLLRLLPVVTTKRARVATPSPVAIVVDAEVTAAAAKITARVVDVVPVVAAANKAVVTTKLKALLSRTMTPITHSLITRVPRAMLRTMIRLLVINRTTTDVVVETAVAVETVVAMVVRVVVEAVAMVVKVVVEAVVMVVKVVVEAVAVVTTAAKMAMAVITNKAVVETVVTAEAAAMVKDAEGAEDAEVAIRLPTETRIHTQHLPSSIE